MNKIEVSNSSERLLEEKIRELFLSYGEIKEFKLSKELDGSHKIRIRVNSCETKKTELLSNDTQVKDSKDIEKKDFSNRQKNEEFFIFYVITVILNYFKGLVKQQVDVFIKYLSYIYAIASNIHEKGTKLDEKYKILDHLFVFFRVILKKIKTINDKYMVDQKIKNFNSKHNILNTIQEKGRIILYNFQYIMSTKTRNKIQVFYTELCKKCKNIHEEAYRLANLKQEKVKIQ
ncbi:hypothetical protein PNEG_00933 [Pneumocystis murina B123]|uniref:RRM domain-containing protein n=1 Tax=Pneumocystis murina (strain B123) TaxID=1069680 RepID=M7PAC7_PNEMU|nr:hypothetical protein PNEG_00933 [Pneumocystis murina B123]EMR10785.1 hypothetical protein PNEG_00933 [Pneumocystis murina B123]